MARNGKPRARKLVKASGNTPTSGGRITYFPSPAEVTVAPNLQWGGVSPWASSGYSARWSQGWFGPGVPFPPVAPQGTEGRAWDYPYGINLQVRPRVYEPLGFLELRSLADSYDLLRLVIETRKDQVEAIGWDIAPSDDYDGKVSDGDVEEVRDFFQRPDREHMWAPWLRELLEEVFVTDALTIYPRWTNGGDLHSLELMDGGTIMRLIDEDGRTPLPPDPAYSQIIKGLPAVHYFNYDGARDGSEVLYLMRNPRVNRMYGLGPVEQVLMTVNIALRRQMSQLSYFTDGNVPEALASTPESWSMDQVKQFQLWFDQLLEGDPSRMRRLRFLPGDATKIVMTKSGEMVLKDLFDEWLARIICFAFSIPPSSLVKETNRATAGQVAEQAKSEGLMPLLNWLKSVFDYIIQVLMERPGIEFRWDMDEEVDPSARSKIDETYIACLVLTPDEVRKERFGLDPLTPEQRATLFPQTGAAGSGMSGIGSDPSAPDPMALAAAKKPPAATAAPAAPGEKVDTAVGAPTESPPAAEAKPPVKGTTENEAEQAASAKKLDDIAARVDRIAALLEKALAARGEEAMHG